jgi:hypothetical protein
MATSEERQARALEGILSQLTFIVALLKKQNEPSIPSTADFDNGVRTTMTKEPAIRVPVYMSDLILTWATIVGKQVTFDFDADEMIMLNEPISVGQIQGFHLNLMYTGHDIPEAREKNDHS